MAPTCSNASRRFLFPLALTLLTTAAGAVAPPVAKPHTFAPIYYLDSRGNNTLSLYYQSKALPWGLQLWGFTDLDSPQNADGRRADLAGFFNETRLTRFFRRGMGVQGEYNDGTRTDDQRLRLGAVYTLPLPGFVQLRAFPLESHGDAQVSVVWRLPLPLPHLQVEGFVDYNFRPGDNRLVAEPQLRYMFNDQWGATLEYRYNQLLRGTGKDLSGLAAGIYCGF